MNEVIILFWHFADIETGQNFPTWKKCANNMLVCANYWLPLKYSVLGSATFFIFLSWGEKPQLPNSHMICRCQGPRTPRDVHHYLEPLAVEACCYCHLFSGQTGHSTCPLTLGSSGDWPTGRPMNKWVLPWGVAAGQRWALPGYLGLWSAQGYQTVMPALLTPEVKNLQSQLFKWDTGNVLTPISSFYIKILAATKRFQHQV